MPLIDLLTAKAHLRVDADYPDEQVQLYLNAAEMAAAQFMNRRVFADQDELDTAVAAVPAALLAAGVAYDDAQLLADDIEDCVARCAAREYAESVYRQARTAALETRCGIVVNDLIKAGILLILGHLHEQREDSVVGASVAELPMGSRYLLQPFRVSIGV